MTDIHIAGAIVAIVIVIVLVLRGKKESKAVAQPAGPIPLNSLNALAWDVGPSNYPGGNPSTGVAVQHPEGWAIDLPQAPGSIHYVTMPADSLAGKTKVTMRFRIEGAPGVKLVPSTDPKAPSLLTLYFQRKGDNWSAVGAFEAYRWFASFATVRNLVPGEYEVTARFDENWTAVVKSSRNTNLDRFNAALADAGRIGFVLGGGDGLGHGAYTTGPARLVVTAFNVE